MGSLTRPHKDQIDIQTDRITPRGTGVRKESHVSVRGNPTLNNVIIGLKIKRTPQQRVSEFSFDGRDMLRFLDAPTGAAFAHAFARSTEPDETWVGLKIDRTDLPPIGGFATAFALEPFNLPVPNFQAVPIVVAFSITELNAGHYFVGTSYVTGPDTQAMGISGR